LKMTAKKHVKLHIFKISVNIMINATCVNVIYEGGFSSTGNVKQAKYTI
jgi:hypothetical protein